MYGLTQTFKKSRRKSKVYYCGTALQEARLMKQFLSKHVNFDKNYITLSNMLKLTKLLSSTRKKTMNKLAHEIIFVNQT